MKHASSRWQPVTWWSKSALLAAGAVAVATLVVLVSTWWLADDAPLDPRNAFWAFSLLPLLLILGIGAVARLQERIDLRSGHDDNAGDRPR